MIPLLLFLLGVAAVYVGTIETAFSALMKLSLRLMAERGGRDDRLGFYLDDPIQLFVPARLLLGIIFSIATVLLAVVTGRWGVNLRAIGLLLACVTAYMFVCEHLLPLAIIRRDPERVLEVLLPPFDVIARLMKPISSGLVKLMTGDRTERASSAPEQDLEEQGEVAHAYLQAGEEQGVIERDERRLLQSIVDFGDTLVREVMTPRPDIVAIAQEATIGNLRALFREQEYSRFPVYKQSLDNIAGFVFIKDLVLLDASDDERPIEPLIRPAVVVPETKLVPALLKQFQRQQTQCAIVVDEYGGTAGLVTIEDLLEEIVGEIRDEYDVESEPIVDEGDGRFVVSGKANIDELAQRLAVEIERGGFETVGGYLLSHIGRVPAVGEKFEIDGLSVEVLEVERRRINRVRMCKEPSSTAAAEDLEEKSRTV